MNLTKEQRDAVDEVIAQHVGQCASDPTDALERVIAEWPIPAREEARERLDENVFYCECCGWYCDADERHDGDLCDDCFDDELERVEDENARDI